MKCVPGLPPFSCSTFSFLLSRRTLQLVCAFVLLLLSACKGRGLPPIHALPGALFRPSFGALCPRLKREVFIDLHAHPFERIIRNQTEQRSGGVPLNQRNELTFDAIRASGLSIMMVSIILPEITKQAMQYVRHKSTMTSRQKATCRRHICRALRDSSPQTSRLYFCPKKSTPQVVTAMPVYCKLEVMRAKIRLEVLQEVALIRNLVRFENDLLRQCWSESVYRNTSLRSRAQVIDYLGGLSNQELRARKFYNRRKKLQDVIKSKTSSHKRGKRLRSCLDLCKKKSLLQDSEKRKCRKRCEQEQVKRELERELTKDLEPVRKTFEKQLGIRSDMKVQRKLSSLASKGDRRQFLSWDELFERQAQSRREYIHKYVSKRLERCRKVGIYGPEFVIVKTPEETERAIKDKNISLILNLEQQGFIRDPDDVTFFYNHGIRMSTLVHLTDNCVSGSAFTPWTDLGSSLGHHPDQITAFRYSCMPLVEKALCLPPPQLKKKQPKPLREGPRRTSCHVLQNTNQGLTEGGLRVFLRMIEVGMMPDLAHLSETSLRQVLESMVQYPKLVPPLIHTHTNFRYDYHSPMFEGRKKKEQAEYAISRDHLLLLSRAGGAVGIGFNVPALDWLLKYRKPLPKLIHGATYYQLDQRNKKQLAMFTKDMAQMAAYPYKPNNRAACRRSCQGRCPTLCQGQLREQSRRQPKELSHAAANYCKASCRFECKGYCHRRGILSLGTDYNGFVTPPDAFSTAGHLPVLMALLRQENCHVYKSLAHSGDHFLSIWRKARKVSQYWQKLTHRAKEVKKLQGFVNTLYPLHKHCPWDANRPGRAKLVGGKSVFGMCRENKSVNMEFPRFSLSLNKTTGWLARKRRDVWSHGFLFGLDAQIGYELIRPPSTEMTFGLSLQFGSVFGAGFFASQQEAQVPQWHLYLRPEFVLHATLLKIYLSAALLYRPPALDLQGVGFELGLGIRYEHIRNGTLLAGIYSGVIVDELGCVHTLRLSVGYNFSTLF